MVIEVSAKNTVVDTGWITLILTRAVIKAGSIGKSLRKMWFYSQEFDHSQALVVSRELCPGVAVPPVKLQ